MEQIACYKELLPGFLIDLLTEQYGEEYAEKIILGYTQKRKVSLRVNTLKTSLEEVVDVFCKSGVSYQAVPWYKDALIIENVDESMLRELSLYNEGKIYFQSLSSMLPPVVLNPRIGADILDMAAAPGSKTTQMAAMTENKSYITACEINAVRTERLKYNLKKQGVSHVYVIQNDARKLDENFAFDQILLDAPCSGSGTLNLSNKKSNDSFSQKLVEKSVKNQRDLILKAIALLKKGQQMVYSTCSVLACENEDVISYALSTGKIKIVPIETKSGQDFPLLPVKLDGVICIAPNELFEGFFIAKLEKI